MVPVVLARIAIRVVAICVIARGIMYLSQIYTELLYLDNYSVLDDADIFWMAFAVLSPVLFGIILWVATPLLAIWVVGDCDTTQEDEMTAGVFQAVAVSTSGLVIIFTSVPDFLSMAFVVYRSADELNGQLIFGSQLVASLVVTGLKVLFGMFLVIGVQYWVRLLQRFQRIGLAGKVARRRL